ncbi:MAG: hypothetical protein ACRDYZ_16740 [Acidimicrobiales bacterium]
MTDSPTDVDATVAERPHRRKWRVNGGADAPLPELAAGLEARRDQPAGSLGPERRVGRHAMQRRQHPTAAERSTVIAACAVAVVAVCVACVVVFGSIEAVRSPVWNPVDEGAHFAYVQQIAEHGSLPVLGKTYVSEQVLALGKGAYPRRVRTDPTHMGLAGDSYEAFQPPLYYAVAVPVFDLSGNFHTKVILMRFFGLFLLVVTIGLYARLCRLLLGERWLLGLAAGTVVLAMPGVVVRCVTLSNLPLEMVLVMACVTELWIAVRRVAPGRLLVAGALLGLGISTDLFSVELVPVYAACAAVVMWRRRTWRSVAWASAGGALALALVAPWLVFNEVHYHSLTASGLAKSMQASTVNPQHVHYGLHLVADLTAKWLFSPALPQEWTVTSRPFLAWGTSALALFVVPASLFLALSLGRQLLPAGRWVLVVPWVFNVALCWYISLGQQWLTMQPRYTYPTLPLLALAMTAGALAILRTRWPFVLTLAGFSVFLVVLWVGLLPQVRPG